MECQLKGGAVKLCWLIFLVLLTPCYWFFHYRQNWLKHSRSFLFFNFHFFANNDNQWYCLKWEAGRTTCALNFCREILKRNVHLLAFSRAVRLFHSVLGVLFVLIIVSQSDYVCFCQCLSWRNVLKSANRYWRIFVRGYMNSNSLSWIYSFFFPLNSQLQFKFFFFFLVWSQVVQKVGISISNCSWEKVNTWQKR